MANANVEIPQGESSVERVLKIKRCAAVVKGGRRFSFAALVVVGDGKAVVVSATVKPTKFHRASPKPKSKPTVKTWPCRSSTVPFRTRSSPLWCCQGDPAACEPWYRYQSLVRPSALYVKRPGIKDILTKSFRSNNPSVLVKATFNALRNFARVKMSSDCEEFPCHDISEVNQGITKNRLRRRDRSRTWFWTSKTAGRGQQRAQVPLWLLASSRVPSGDLPLVRRIPKRGFNKQVRAERGFNQPRSDRTSVRCW